MLRGGAGQRWWVGALVWSRVGLRASAHRLILLGGKVGSRALPLLKNLKKRGCKTAKRVSFLSFLTTGTPTQWHSHKIIHNSRVMKVDVSSRATLESSSSQCLESWSQIDSRVTDDSIRFAWFSDALSAPNVWMVFLHLESYCVVIWEKDIQLVLLLYCTVTKSGERCPASTESSLYFKPFCRRWTIIANDAGLSLAACGSSREIKHEPVKLFVHQG